jgi:hypothetical protein
MGCSAGEPTTPQHAEHLLTVALSAGVTSNLPSGESDRTEGEVVQYSFAPRVGYRNLRVVLDGIAVPTDSQLTMDRAHWIVASADPLVSLTVNDSMVIRDVSAVAQTRNPEALRNVLQRLADSLVAVSPNDAASSFEGFLARALVPERDAGVLAAALQLPSASSMQNALTEDADVTQPRTKLVYVNGVLTTQQEFDLTWKGALAPLAQRRGLTPTAHFDVGGFYNISGTVTETTAREFLMCVMLKALSIRLGDFSALTSITDCWPDGTGLTIFGVPVADFTQAAEQLVNLVFAGGYPPFVQSESRSLAGHILSARLNNDRVILVGHSQGNLLIAEALKAASADSRWRSYDGACVGWVAIAPPLAPTGVNISSMNSPSSVIVKGTYWNDVLYPLLSKLPGGGSVHAMPNELSSTFDQDGWLSLVQQLWPPYRFGVGVALHGVLGSYFGMPATENWIGNALESQSADLDDSCSPPSVLTISSSIPNGYVVARAGNTTVDVPLTMTLSGRLESSAAVPVELFLSTDWRRGPTGSLAWTSSGTDFPSSVLNSGVSRTSTARFNTGTLSPNSYYWLHVLVNRNQTHASATSSGLTIGVVTFFQYPLTQLPVSFPADAIHPNANLPFIQSTVSNETHASFAPVPFAPPPPNAAWRLTAVEYRVAGTTVADMIRFYEQKFAQKGLTPVTRSITNGGSTFWYVYSTNMSQTEPDFTATDGEAYIYPEQGGVRVYTFFLFRSLR